MGALPVHVVLCTDGIFPHAIGGMQRHSRLLAEHLAGRDDIRLTVMHPHQERIFPAGSGISEHQVGAIRPDRTYLLELWRYSARVEKALVELRPDVVLSQGFCVWKGAARWNDRLVVMPHGLEMFQGISLAERMRSVPFRLAMRDVVRGPRFVVALGGRLTAILRRLTKGSGTSVIEIPNASDSLQRMPPYPESQSPLRLLFVGRFAFNKGLDLLLETARVLVDEGLGDAVRFELAGDGPMMETIRSAGVPANVHLLGRVDDDQLRSAYARAHALVLPTRFEGMPTVVIEAMARARPVIVSDVGASSDLITAQSGMLIPPGDATALTAAIKGLLDMPLRERELMGSAGYRLFQERFTWTVVSERFADLAHQVAGASGSVTNAS